MKKNKSQQVDLFYFNKEEKKNKKKNNVKQEAGKKRPARVKKQEDTKSELFSFDDEIVIGITKIPDKSSKKQSNKKRAKQVVKKQDRQVENSRGSNKSNSSVSGQQSQKIASGKKTKQGQITKNTEEKLRSGQNKKTNGKSANDKNIKDVEKHKKRKKRIALFLKCFSVMVVLMAAALFMFLSPTFDIKTITVEGNQKITSQEIISLSQISLDQNTFTIRLSQVEANIKEQPYIESVQVKRILPGEIAITVTEREPSFMIAMGNAYVYLNNQGYFLETSETKLTLPMIEGYSTQLEQIKPGNRLIKEDLEKLEMVLRIERYAKTNGIAEKITKINIADPNNYTLRLEEEKKTVYLGDASYIDKKMQYLVIVLQDEAGIEAEVFLNVDINQENFYVREQV